MVAVNAFQLLNSALGTGKITHGNLTVLPKAVHTMYTLSFINCNHI